MKHEAKYCARCNALFECKVGSVGLCQCAAVKLDDDERSYIRASYTDCLCAACLKDLKSGYHQGKWNNRIKHLFRKLIS